MERFESNSHKYKQEQKTSNERPEIKPVVKNEVKVKKNDLRRFAGAIISEEAHNVKNYILMDVIIPAIRNTIVDIITGSTQRIFGGGSTSKPSTPASRFSYNNCYRKEDSTKRAESVQSNRFYYDDIVFKDRLDAENVLEAMDNIIAQYNMVSVNDLFDLVGRSGSPQDARYGWTSLSTARVDWTREGYILNLPKALPLV